jgi:hypothetical protein
MISMTIGIVAGMPSNLTQSLIDVAVTYVFCEAVLLANGGLQIWLLLRLDFPSTSAMKACISIKVGVALSRSLPSTSQVPQLEFANCMLTSLFAEMWVIEFQRVAIYLCL